MRLQKREAREVRPVFVHLLARPAFQKVALPKYASLITSVVMRSGADEVDQVEPVCEPTSQCQEKKEKEKGARDIVAAIMS